jgi:hypothetical protein
VIFVYVKEFPKADQLTRRAFNVCKLNKEFGLLHMSIYIRVMGHIKRMLKAITRTSMGLQANKANVEKIAPFESAIKRPYFHVKPLDQVQLSVWWQYLDYKMKSGTHAAITRLFERCLVPCAAYSGMPSFGVWSLFAYCRGLILLAAVCVQNGCSLVLIWMLWLCITT